MAYLDIADFKYGMDRRRPQAIGVPGTLWELENAVISRGGDIERAKRWAPIFNLPSDTKGLAEISGQLYTFAHTGSVADYPGLTVQVLSIPDGATITRVLDSEAYDGKIYVIVEVSDGHIYHYYDGARVTAWDGLASGAMSEGAIATLLAERISENAGVYAEAFGADIYVTARTPGTPFTYSSATSGLGTPTLVTELAQDNVAEQSALQPVAEFTITGGSAVGALNGIAALTVDGVDFVSVDLIGGTLPEQNFQSTTDALATAIAVQITNQSDTHNFTASASGSTVTVFAPMSYAEPNNPVYLNVTVKGDVTVDSASVAFSDGATARSAVAQVVRFTVGASSLDAGAQWTATINSEDYRCTGRASGMGTSCLAYKRRIYCTANSLYRYCKIGEPSDWTDGAAASGAGFINIAQQSTGAQRLIGSAVYNNYVAIFSRTTVLLYRLETDAQTNEFIQTVENIGTAARNSIVSYGSTDVFFLDDTGVRSLKSRSGYDAAYSSDVGNSIDPYIQEIVDNLSGATVSNAQSVIEGRDGRFFMALGDKIIVLSYFPASDISAWSYFSLGGQIDGLVRANRNVFVRVGDTVYRYGGTSGNEYPLTGEAPVTVVTSFLDASNPATRKMLEAFDMVASNTWKIEVLTDPNDPTLSEEVGIMRGSTYNDLDAFMSQYTGSFALRMTCTRAGAATISATAQHFENGEQS